MPNKKNVQWKKKEKDICVTVCIEDCYSVCVVVVSSNYLVSFTLAHTRAHLTFRLQTNDEMSKFVAQCTMCCHSCQT